MVEFFYPEEIAAFEREFVEAQQAAYMETCVEDDEIAERMDAGPQGAAQTRRQRDRPYQSPMEDGMQHLCCWPATTLAAAPAASMELRDYGIRAPCSHPASATSSARTARSMAWLPSRSPPPTWARCSRTRSTRRCAHWKSTARPWGAVPSGETLRFALSPRELALLTQDTDWIRRT